MIFLKSVFPFVFMPDARQLLTRTNVLKKFWTDVMEKQYFVRCKTAFVFLFQSENVNKCLSIAPKTPMQTREHGVPFCNLWIWSSTLCCGSVFSRYLRLLLIARNPMHIAGMEHSCLSFQAPPVSYYTVF